MQRPNYLYSMKLNEISFKKANEYIKWILVVGLAIGVANFALGVWPTLGQSIVQHIITSFIIGYSLLLVVFNLPHFLPDNISDVKKYGIFIILFSLIGFLGSEIEILVRRFLFQQGDYQFLTGGGIYLFNAILSTILGFGIQTWVLGKNTTEIQIENQPTPIQDQSPEISTTIPIKQGENINLHSLENVIYFEAYDNYSFLFDLDGKKHLCNYSLLFLEKKLTQNFLRVHRKYLINKHQISQIKPHLKGRYVIVFKDKKQSSITSSNSHADIIKSLIKF